MWAALLRRWQDGGSYHVSTSLAQASMWVLDQGPVARPPGAEDIAPYRIQDGDLGVRQCAYGAVTHANPLIRYSGSPSRWDLPPQPPGASPPEWREAERSGATTTRRRA